MADKYKEFMNYMKNELGITRQDIQNWTQDAVKEVAKDYVEHHFSQYSFRKHIEALILDNSTFSLHDNFEKSIKSMVAQELANRIEIDLKEPEDE